METISTSQSMAVEISSFSCPGKTTDACIEPEMSDGLDALFLIFGVRPGTWPRSPRCRWWSSVRAISLPSLRRRTTPRVFRSPSLSVTSQISTFHGFMACSPPGSLLPRLWLPSIRSPLITSPGRRHSSSARQMTGSAQGNTGDGIAGGLGHRSSRRSGSSSRCTGAESRFSYTSIRALMPEWSSA